jgi:hypothetical protein
MDQTTEHTMLREEDKNINNQHPDHKLSISEIRTYLNKTLSLFFLTCLTGYTPGLLILFNRYEDTQKEVFFKIWWIILIGLALNIGIAVWVYYNRQRLYNNYLLTSILFIFYFSSVMGIDLVVSLYSPELTLTFFSNIGFGLLACLILNNFSYFDFRGWVKLSIIYIIVFINLIVYMIIVQKYIVEFFILCIISILFFSYAVLELKHLLYQYSKEGRYHQNLSHINFYLYSIMVTGFNLIICSFK